MFPLPSFSIKTQNNSDIRIIISILVFYFFFCFPLAQAYLKNHNFLYNYWSLFFCIATLMTLFATGKLRLSKIGVSRFHWRQINLGIFLLLLPLTGVVFLDAIIVKTGMADNNLFFGAELRKLEGFSNTDLLLEGFLSPIISQLFITGYVLNGLVKNNAVAIAANGVLYSAINLNFGIGFLALGIISAGLVRFTGYLMPAILFSLGCAFAKILILTTYPRLTTILVFLN
jgi:hypothetical protein